MTNSGKFKNRVSHYKDANGIEQPGPENYDPSIFEDNNNSSGNSWSASDIASVIGASGKFISDALKSIFQKETVNNTYVTNTGGDDDKSNTGLYIGIGAGVLVLVIVLIVVLARRK